MFVFIVIFGILILLALLRFGVTAEYNAGGAIIHARVGFLTIRLYPRETAQKRIAKDKKRKKAKKTKKKDGKTDTAGFGGVEGFLEIIQVAKIALGRMRRRLLVKNLTIRYAAAGEDPSKTAILFGRLSAVISATMPALDSIFRIKRRDIRACADFISAKPSIYANAAVSIALWEALYIAAALLPLIKRSAKRLR